MKQISTYIPFNRLYDEQYMSKLISSIHSHLLGSGEGMKYEGCTTRVNDDEQRIEFTHSWSTPA